MPKASELEGSLILGGMNTSLAQSTFANQLQNNASEAGMSIQSDISNARRVINGSAVISERSLYLMLNRPHSSLIMKNKGGSTGAAAPISRTTNQKTNGRTASELNGPFL